jgi:hypothetical protein
MKNSDTLFKDMGGNEHISCVPCKSFLGGPEPEACTHFQDYLTSDEEEALARLRQIKEEARMLRGRIRGLENAIELASSGESEKIASGIAEEQRYDCEGLRRELEECSSRLVELRGHWRDWQKRREQANYRKMVLLGHYPWQETAAS